MAIEQLALDQVLMVIWWTLVVLWLVIRAVEHVSHWIMK